MNVFILDRSMEKSAQMLDDAHLKAQINEACQILMANYNHCCFPDAKIGHINHPVTKFYAEGDEEFELYSYLNFLLKEYKFRFQKKHQNELWLVGFSKVVMILKRKPFDYFSCSKSFVNDSMTDNIEEIRKYISTKPMKKKPTWTNRNKPDWWEV